MNERELDSEFFPGDIVRFKPMPSLFGPVVGRIGAGEYEVNVKADGIVKRRLFSSEELELVTSSDTPTDSGDPRTVWFDAAVNELLDADRAVQHSYRAYLEWAANPIGPMPGDHIQAEIQRATHARNRVYDLAGFGPESSDDGKH